MTGKILDPTNGEEATWVDELRCFVHSIEYYPTARAGSVVMLTGNSVDMSGVIRLFTRIDLGVTSILTSHPAPTGAAEPLAADTAYFKTETGWEARRASAPRPIRHWTGTSLN